MNIYEIINKAQKLRNETRLDSITPERVGSIQEETLKCINEYQLISSSVVMHKIYSSVSAMQADKSPKSDLTGNDLKPGQLVVIAPVISTDITSGDVYRYDGPSGNTSAWTYVSKIGSIFIDAELSETSKNPVQNKAITKKLNELSKIKFNGEGNYPAMTAGYANNLVGRGESTPEMFSFRASGGRSINDGAARIKTLRGNSVVWNQHLSIKTKLTYSNAAGSSHYSLLGLLPYYNTAINGRRIFAIATDSKNQLKSIYFNDELQRDLRGGYIFTANTTVPDRTSVFAEIEAGVAVNTDVEVFFYDLTQMFGAGNEPTSVEEFNAMLPLNVDLNAYNEGEVIPFSGRAIKSVGDNAWDGLREMGDISGTTGEEFSSSSMWRTSDYIRILPNAEYCVEYTSSTFLRARFYDKHKNFIGIVSANNTDIYTNQTFTAPNNAYFIRFAPNLSVIPYDSELCVRLVHSGWKQDTGAPFEPYQEFIRNIDTRILDLFPNGMHKWDKAYNKNGKGYVVKGTGVVDLGTLTWRSSGSNGSAKIWNSPIGFPSAVKANNVIGNILTAEYITATGDDVYLLNMDKSIALAYTSGGNYLSVYNNAFVSAEDETAFVESMQGVMLYYELAEPQVYEFAEPFNLDYDVSDFGTEEVIASKPSAPISADIIYQFNAVDTIRDNQAEIEKIKAALAKAGITIDL